MRQRREDHARRAMTVTTPQGAGTIARDGGSDGSAIRHQRAWLDKRVREGEDK